MTATYTTDLEVVDESSVKHVFAIGSKGIHLQTRQWERADATTSFRIPLHPWRGGLDLDRIGGRPNTYAKGNCDASWEGELLFPPKINSVTLANAVLPSKEIEFDGKKFLVGGRYMYYYNPATNTATEDKDFGSGKAAVDAGVFNNQLVVAMGETEKIYTRSIGTNASGTANAAVTSTDTTLTDTRLAMTTDAYIGATVTCNGKTMVVTTNSATVFTGASWSGGGNPGNGNAWSVAGTWTQATDSTYAIALGQVAERLWRAETTNRISSCSTAPLTLASWTPASPNQYYCGDTTWPVHTIIEYGGIAWIGKGDGIYAPDPATRFKNQTPQARRQPNTNNARGAFVAARYLWVPTASGLLRISPGEAKPRGPEVTHRPDFRFWVRGGVEVGEAIYLLCSDSSATSNTCIIKMEKDTEGLSGHEYRYHEWASLGATTVGYFIGLTTAGTNPQLVAGFGNNMVYIVMGRGGGRDVDDANYSYGTAMTLETGVVVPESDMANVATLVGVQAVLDYSRTDESLSIAYAWDRISTGNSYTDLLTTAEGGGTAAITTSGGYEKVTRYAAAQNSGHFIEVKFTGALVSATAGKVRPSLREAWAFGYIHPKITDELVVPLTAEPDGTWVRGRKNGKSRKEMLRIWRDWQTRGVELTCKIADYEEGRTTRFLVRDVADAQVVDTIGRGQVDSQTTSEITVKLVRVDRAGAYATT